MLGKCIFIDTQSKDKDKIIFNIVENNYKNGKKTVIFTADEERANYIDRFLWVFKQESFIPHKIFKYKEEETLESVAIVLEEFNPIDADKVILDAPASLDFVKNFQEVYDFVDYSSKTALQESRMRFKNFRDSGFVMQYQKD